MTSRQRACEVASMRPTLLLQLIFREGSMRFGSEVICDPHQLGANEYILAALGQRQDPNDEALHSLAIHGAPRPRDNLDTIPKCFAIKIQVLGSYSYVEAACSRCPRGWKLARSRHCACSDEVIE